MMEMFAVGLASYGLAFGLINKARFLRRVSILKKMLDCVYCTGFHTGWITFIMIEPFTSLRQFDYLSCLLTAFASSAFCYTLDTLIIYLEHKTAELKVRNNDSNLLG